MDALVVVALVCLYTFVVIPRPYLAVGLATLLFGTPLLQTWLDWPQYLIRLLPVILLASAVAWTAIGNQNPSFKGKTSLAYLSLALVPGALVSLSQNFWYGAIAAPILYLTLPMAYFIGRRIAGKSLLALMRAVDVLLTANLVLAIWEWKVGVDGMLATGIKYGATVRTINGLIRATGLTLINVDLGLFGASIALIYIVLLSVKSPIRPKVEMYFAVSIGLTVVVLSTSRSAMVLVLVGCATLLCWNIFRANARVSFLSLMSAVCLVGFGAYAFVGIGATSSSSLEGRQYVWTHIVSQGLSFFGLGSGRVGGLSYSSLNPYQSQFVDNMWISFIVQFGFWGGILGFIALAQSIREVWKVRHSNPSYFIYVAAFTFSYLVVGFLVEFGDFPLGLLIFAIVGGWLSQNQNPSSDCENSG